MRTTAFLGLFVVGIPLLVAACSGKTKGEAKGSTADTTPAAEVPALDPDARWVWASSLNLRASSDPESEVLGKLSINDQVTLLEAGDPLSKVRAANGTEGWAGSKFLESMPLVVEVARSRMQTARDEGDERTPWPASPIAARDVDGDGKPEIAWDAGCGGDLRALDGTELSDTAWRCCW